MDLNEHDLKKQISSITKTDVEMTPSQEMSSQNIQSLFFSDLNDPDKPEFWEDVILTDPELSEIPEELIFQMMADLPNLNRKQSMKLSKKLSSFKNESVEMKIEFNINQDESASDSQQQSLVFITGQFNNWQIEEMHHENTLQNKIKFTYSKEVIGGQIYNYYFLVNGEHTVDSSQKVTQSGKANWIFVPFSKRNQEKARNMFQRPLAMRVFKLQKLSQQIQFLSLKGQKIKPEEEKEKKQISQNYNKLLITINQDILERFVYQKSDFQEKKAVYRVIDFIPSSRNSEIKIQRLLDQNMICLDLSKSQNVQSIQIEQFFQEYEIMEMPKEVILRKELSQSKKYWFFIRYFAEGGECFPMEIRPQVNINDYDINFNNGLNKVTGITNKQYGTQIKFHDMTMEELEGYVQNSTVEVWTQLDLSDNAQETLNIVHIHVNDTSDLVSFDVAYLHQNEKLGQHQSFAADFSGRALKYKIIVKDVKIFKILYNMGVDGNDVYDLDSDQIRSGVIEIPFVEKKIQENDYIVIGDQTQKSVLAKIVNIPTGMISSADKNKVQNHKQIQLKNNMKNYCTSRSFDELLGYVDIQILANFDKQLKEFEPENCSHCHPNHDHIESGQAQPVCTFVHANQNLIQEYFDSLQIHNKKQQNNLANLLQILEQKEIEAKENINFLREGKISKEEAKKYVQDLQSQLNDIEDAFEDLETNEGSADLFEKYDDLREECNQDIAKLVRLTKF